MATNRDKKKDNDIIILDMNFSTADQWLAENFASMNLSKLTSDYGNMVVKDMLTRPLYIFDDPTKPGGPARVLNQFMAKRTGAYTQGLGEASVIFGTIRAMLATRASQLKISEEEKAARAQELVQNIFAFNKIVISKEKIPKEQGVLYLVPDQKGGVTFDFQSSMEGAVALSTEQLKSLKTILPDLDKQLEQDKPTTIVLPHVVNQVTKACGVKGTTLQFAYINDKNEPSAIQLWVSPKDPKKWIITVFDDTTNDSLNEKRVTIIHSPALMGKTSSADLKSTTTSEATVIRETLKKALNSSAVYDQLKDVVSDNLTLDLSKQTISSKLVKSNDPTVVEQVLENTRRSLEAFFAEKKIDGPLREAGQNAFDAIQKNEDLSEREKLVAFNYLLLALRNPFEMTPRPALISSVKIEELNSFEEALRNHVTAYQTWEKDLENEWDKKEAPSKVSELIGERFKEYEWKQTIPLEKLIRLIEKEETASRAAPSGSSLAEARAKCAREIKSSILEINQHKRDIEETIKLLEVNKSTLGFDVYRSNPELIVEKQRLETSLKSSVQAINRLQKNIKLRHKKLTFMHENPHFQKLVQRIEKFHQNKDPKGESPLLAEYKRTYQEAEADAVKLLSGIRINDDGHNLRLAQTARTLESALAKIDETLKNPEKSPELGEEVEKIQQSSLSEKFRGALICFMGAAIIVAGFAKAIVLAESEFMRQNNRLGFSLIDQGVKVYKGISTVEKTEDKEAVVLPKTIRP